MTQNNDPAMMEEWLKFGGVQTLLSYGIAAARIIDPAERSRTANALIDALPRSHRHFLASLRSWFLCGDFLFVHAGIRPGIPLEEQEDEDLFWIRDDFLRCDSNFGMIVVHGHTPVERPEILPNRINIDTGAYATGRLTCLMIERDTVSFL